jgi:Tfp pilus assembly protein PilV
MWKGGMSGTAIHPREFGGSLVEVLVALALVASTMLAAVASQLHAVTAERSAARREQALLIAASMADSLRDGSPSAPALPFGHGYAGTSLPGAEISIVDEMERVSLAVISWPDEHADESRGRTHAGSCPPDTPAARACAALPFVR